MKKPSFKLLFTITIFLLVFHFAVRESSAQTCSGSYTSTNLYRCAQNGLGSWTCPQNGTSTSTCNNGALGCLAIAYSAENCDLGINGSSCAAYNRVDGTTSSGCSLAPPTGPAPSGGGGGGGPGSCDGCSDAGSCSGRGGSWSASSGTNYPECAAQGGYCSGTTNCGGGGGGGGGGQSCVISMGAPAAGANYTVGQTVSSTATLRTGDGYGNFGDIRFRTLDAAATVQDYTVVNLRRDLTSTSQVTCYANGNCVGSATGPALRNGTAVIRAIGRVRACPSCALIDDPNCYAQRTVTVGPVSTPPPPPPGPTLNLSINPTSILVGQSATLTWSSSNTVNPCTASGAWSGNKNTGGTQSTGTLSTTGSRTYTLQCTNSAGTAITRSVTLAVTNSPTPTPSPTPPPPPPNPTVDLRINNNNGPITVTNGDSANLTWTSSNATSCTASGAWSGSRAVPSGSASTGAITSSRTWTLTCRNSAGVSRADSVTANVTGVPTAPPTPPPASPTLNLSVSPTSVQTGTAATLTWSSSNTVNPCVASGAWTGNKNIGGSQSTGTFSTTGNRTFTLRCNNSSGVSITRSVTLSVTANPTPAPTPTPTAPPLALPTVDLRANGNGGPISVNQGTSVTLSWSVNNASACTASANPSNSNWTGSKNNSSGSQSSGSLSPAGTKSFTLSCSNASGTRSDRVDVNVVVPTPTPTAAPGQCQTPRPFDPPGSTCAANSTSNGTITWSWAPVAIANQYRVIIINSAGSTVSDTGFQNQSFFNCGSGTCRHTTSHLPGTQYRSRIIAREASGICTASGFVTSTPYEVPICTGPTVDLRANGTNGLNVASGTSVTLSWANTNVNSCTASNDWSGNKTPASGGSQPSGPITATRTFTLTCTGAGGRTANDSVTVGLSAAQCAAPAPRDPPSGTCAPDILTGGDVTWEWDRVPNADQYSFMVVNTTTGITVPSTVTGWLNDEDFNCGSAGQACSQITNLLPGIYHSRIAARSTTNVCTTSIFSISPNYTVDLCNANPWWQVGRGGITATRNVISPIPAQCGPSPSCIDRLLLDDPESNQPGNAVYGGSTADFAAGNPTGTVSSRRWLTNTATVPSIYSYAYFANLASGRFTPNSAPATINNGVIASAPVGSDGYSWLHRSGSLTIDQPGVGLNINKKVVLFVDGDVNINSRININNLTDNFFMVIASGNITVSPSVSSSDSADVAIQGIYHTNGSFSTGTTGVDDEMLVVEGSVSAGSVNLERDLVTENDDTPGELFIYSPELAIGYPSALSDKHLVWREVAP